jgi:hypothetical protein
MNGKLNSGWVAAWLLVLVAATAPAQADDKGEQKVQKEKIVIITDGHHADGESSGAAGHHAMIMGDCEGDRTEVAGGDEAKGEKAKIVICSRGNASAEERTKRLEHALERINADDSLSAETKAKITTALRDAITRVNTAH